MTWCWVRLTTGVITLSDFVMPPIALSSTTSPPASDILTVNLTANPSVFDPSVSSTSLNYLLSRDATVTLNISGPLGIVYQQAYVAGNFGGKNGLNQVAWSGKNGGQSLPNGTYFVQLNASAAGQQVSANTNLQISAGVWVPTATPTPAPTLDIDNLNIHPSSLPQASAKVVKVDFALNMAASVQIQMVLQATGEVFKSLSTSGSAGSNTVVLSDFNRELAVGVYTIVVSATNGGSNAQSTGIFTVRP